jgi:hypothetical protein
MSSSRPFFNASQQTGVVDVFKETGALSKGKNCKVTGNCVRVTDETIKKPVYALSGGRGHSLQIPEDKAGPLGLLGAFVYFQLRSGAVGRYFAVHIDVSSSAGLTVRLSFSNSFKTVKVRARRRRRREEALCVCSQCNEPDTPPLCSSGVQVVDRVVQFPAGFLNAVPAVSADDSEEKLSAGGSLRWCIFSMHLPSLIGAYVSGFVFGMIRSFTVVGDLRIRNVWTSTAQYDAKSLPGAMVLPLRPGQEWDEAYDWYDGNCRQPLSSRCPRY